MPGAIDSRLVGMLLGVLLSEKVVHRVQITVRDSLLGRDVVHGLLVLGSFGALRPLRCDIPVPSVEAAVRRQPVVYAVPVAVHIVGLGAPVPAQAL